MALENFTTYTEVDPNSHISVAASQIDFTGLDRAEAAYVYKDKGVNHFAGDFEHLLEIKITADSTGLELLWSLANEVDAWAGQGGLGVFFFNNLLYLQERGGNPADNGAVSLNTIYYLKIKRDETAGFLYCYIYSDAARTTLVDTLSVALAANTDFRYVYGCSSYNSGVGTGSGYTKDLDLQEGATYTLTAAVGSFVLTGIAALFIRILNMTASAGSYVLTGVAAGLNRVYEIVAGAGSYILTGITADLRRGIWTNLIKTVSTITNQSKNSAVMTNIAKNTATMTNTAKNSAVMTNTAKNTAVISNLNKS